MKVIFYASQLLLCINLIFYKCQSSTKLCRLMYPDSACSHTLCSCPGSSFPCCLLLPHYSALFHLSVSHPPLSLLPFFSSSSVPPYSFFFLWSLSICFFTLPLSILTQLKGSLSHTLSPSLLSFFSLSVFLLICLPPSLSLPPSLTLPPFLPPCHPPPSLSLHAHLIHFTHYGSIHHFALWRKNLFFFPPFL